MRLVVNSFILVLAFAATVTAQSIDDELARLRELLNVPSSISIVPSTASLPANSPIRVLVSVGPNQTIQNAFTKRINDWNKTSARRYGAIELVSQLSDADIILARYEVELKNVPPLSYSLPLVATRSYSYLIARKPDKLEMLWRSVTEGYSDPGDVKRRGAMLRNEFFKRMKARRTK